MKVDNTIVTRNHKIFFSGEVPIGENDNKTEDLIKEALLEEQPPMADADPGEGNEDELRKGKGKGKGKGSKE